MVNYQKAFALIVMLSGFLFFIYGLVYLVDKASWGTLNIVSFIDHSIPLIAGILVTIIGFRLWPNDSQTRIMQRAVG